MTKRTIEIGPTVICSAEYGVTTVTSRGGKKHTARNKPCQECPWRKDVPTGVFPPKAFQTSAHTAYDAALSTFACHMSGREKPATCAGFLVRHGENNVAVRLQLHGERIDLDRVSDGGFPIYDSYRDMAVANGVDRDDPALQPVRANGDEYDPAARAFRPKRENKDHPGRSDDDGSPMQRPLGGADRCV